MTKVAAYFLAVFQRCIQLASSYVRLLDDENNFENTIKIKDIVVVIFVALESSTVHGYARGSHNTYR